MLELITSFLLLLGGTTEVGYSTRFASVDPVTGGRDKHAGGPSPCLKRLVRPTDNIIAHRTLPCGTRVRLTNLRNGRTTLTRVGERGPYGACIKDGWAVNPVCPKGYWRVKKKKKDPGVWRGSFDLTDRVGRALRHKGFDLLQLEVIGRRKARQGPAQVARR